MRIKDAVSEELVGQSLTMKGKGKESADGRCEEDLTVTESESSVYDSEKSFVHVSCWMGWLE